MLLSSLTVLLRQLTAALVYEKKLKGNIAYICQSLLRNFAVHFTEPHTTFWRVIVDIAQYSQFSSIIVDTSDYQLAFPTVKSKRCTRYVSSVCGSELGTSCVNIVFRAYFCTVNS